MMELNEKEETNLTKLGKLANKHLTSKFQRAMFDIFYSIQNAYQSISIFVICVIVSSIGGTAWANICSLDTCTYADNSVMFLTVTMAVVFIVYITVIDSKFENPIESLMCTVLIIGVIHVNTIVYIVNAYIVYLVLRWAYFIYAGVEINKKLKKSGKKEHE